MIYFITDKKDMYMKLIDTSLFTDVKIMDNNEGLALFTKTIRGKRSVTLDIEASDLDAYRANLLLLGVGVKSKYFMFDHTCDITTVTKTVEKKYVVGHNLKYDIKILKVNTGILIKRLYDTMIAEQRMFMGAGYQYGYDMLVQRYIGESVMKATRNEFVNANPETFKVTYNHLNYLRTDLKHLSTIKKMQSVRMKAQKQEFLIYGIENALVSVIANAELQGFVLNKEKWLERVTDDLDKRFKILLKLDGMVKEMRDSFPNVKVDLLTGGKWNKVRRRDKIVDLINTDGTTEILDLFGEPASVISLFSKRKPSVKAKPITKSVPKIQEYPGCVRYTKQEMIHIFGALNQQAITEIESFSIPKFRENGNLIDFNTYSVKEGVLERYRILRPNSPMLPFLDVFGELQKINKSISTYGKSFIDKIHEITGKIHTAFGQCFTDTGRMSSGGGKNEPDKYNAQNIPRDKRLRNAFGIEDTHLLDTADYSGAELIVMASHAQDFKLLELSKGDMHSHFATLGWRAAYKVRAGAAFNTLRGIKGSDAQIDKLKDDYANLVIQAETFTVTKSEPEGYRQAYKPITFGVIYGMYAKKLAVTLNIAVNEAQAIINGIDLEIPKTMNMVKDRSLYAEAYGHVIHNQRTNSRRWFPALIKAIKGEYTKKDNFIDISSALSAARNTTIQGTQADFVKEASVKLQYFYWKKGYDAHILSWVHDEIVDKLPKEHAEELSKIKKKIMIDTANLYLDGVTIDVEQELLPYWTK